MIKLLKSYYYAFQPIILLLTIGIIRYLWGDESALNVKRITIYVVGGFLIGTCGHIWDNYKRR
ncbi:MAG: hypothetical protein AAGJ18_13295, partial [Bacteroidota bacterium]